MTRGDRALCAVYAVIAVVALVATWWHNVAFLTSGQGESLLDFIRAGYANHAAASLTNDVVLAGAAVFVFMAVEARRLGISRVWLYFVISMVVAVSVRFPIFLIVRQIALARHRSAHKVQT